MGLLTEKKEAKAAQGRDGGDSGGKRESGKTVGERKDRRRKRGRR